MKKFTEDEINGVLQALSDERAKVTELELRLQKLQVNDKPPISNELLKQFKQLLKAFKKKQEEQNAALRKGSDAFQPGEPSQTPPSSLEEELQSVREEKCALQHQILSLKTALEKSKQSLSHHEQETDKQHGSLAESRVHSQQLEKVVQILREKSEAANLEIEQLQRELQAAHDSEEHLQKDLSELQTSEQTLKIELSNEQQEKDEALEEIRCVQAQFEVLRKNIRHLQLQQEVRDISLQDLTAENQRLLNKIEEKNRTFIGFESELSGIKQSLVSGLREAKELEDRFLEAVKEKVEAISKFSLLQRSADKHRLEIERLKSHSKELFEISQMQQEGLNRQQLDHDNEIHTSQMRLEEKDKEIETLKQQAAALTSKLNAAVADIEEMCRARQCDQAELAKHAQIVQEKQSAIKDILDRLLTLEEDKNYAYDELGSCHAALEDKEHQFDEAQQHLAKKFRENAVLDAKIEELNQQLSEADSMRSMLENHRSELKINLQKTLDEQALQNQKIHALMREIENWQGKHSQLEHKWQDALQKIEELEKISARHQQLQSMVSNFGNFFRSQSEESHPVELPPPMPQRAIPQFGSDVHEPQQSLFEIEEDSSRLPEKQEPRHYKNLFNINKPPFSPKKDLFE